jgi:hypothetical protein
VFADCFIHLLSSLQLIYSFVTFLLSNSGCDRVLSLRHHGSEVQETCAAVASGGTSIGEKFILFWHSQDRAS